MRPAPLNIVRALTVVITSAIWWVLLWGGGWAFAGGGKVDYVSPVVIANLTLMSYLFVPFFATEGVLVSMLGALMKKRIVMPQVVEDPKARPGNPWILALINVVVFGVVPGVIGYMMSKGVAPNTLTPSAFAVRYAWGGAAVCALVAAFVSGRPFLKQVRVPAANRTFKGDVNQYLWTRHILPHGIANLLINGALAFALSPVSISEPGAIVKAEVVVVDTLLTLVVLTWLISAGAKGLARSDTEWGIATHDFTADLNMPSAFLPTFFSGVGFCIVLGIGFAWFDIPGLSVMGWAIYRGIFFGVYCGWVAKRCAQASINETFHPEVIVHTRPPKTVAVPTVVRPS